MNNLKNYRLKKNLTQLQVAKYLNIKQATYSGYELSKYEPPIETLKKLSTLFNTSIDNLVDNQQGNTASPIQSELIDEILHSSDKTCYVIKSFIEALKKNN